MKIIIGLGNPGKKYENTRHNVGFMTIDEFAKENNFPDFELQKKFEAEVSEKDDILLAKPQTFMNESGKSAQRILKNRQETETIIIHDDIDLPVGKIKIIKDRGSAGHKGVESIIQNIGNNNIIRIRIGIASPAEALAKEGQGKKIKAKNIVLKNFSPEEQKEIDEVIKKSAKAIKLLLEQGLDKAMNEYNK